VNETEPNDAAPEAQEGATPDPTDDELRLILADSSDDDEPIRENDHAKKVERQYKGRVRAYTQKAMAHMSRPDREDFKDP